MNNTGIGIIKIRMMIFSLFYATIMQLTSLLYLSYNSQTELYTLTEYLHKKELNIGTIKVISFIVNLLASVKNT